MNTLTNAYVTKFSSGTILALLLVSGLFFLVPAVTPVRAANANQITISSLADNAVLAGSAGNVVTFSVGNPSSNAYAINTVVILLPTGWTATACVQPGTFTACSTATAGQVSYTGGALIPGGTTGPFSVTLTAPTPSSFPTSYTFNTEDQDASGAAYTQGPSFPIVVVDSTTVVTISDFAAPYTCPPGTDACFTAGGSAITLTATVTAAEAQTGLTINWALSGASAGYAAHGYTLTASSTTVSASTTTATATATFVPSNTLADTTSVSATIGTGSAAALTKTTAHVLYTQASTPSAVTVTACGAAGATQCSSTKTVYINDYLLSGTVNYARIAIGSISGTTVDAFGNAVSGLVGQTCVITAFGGGFGATPTTTASTDTTASCSAAGAIASDKLFFQGGAFGTTSYVQITISGTGFSASGRSTTLSTSTFDTPASAAPTTTFVGFAPAAGNAAGVATTIALSCALTNAQAGVPITFNAYNTTELLTAVSGSFVGGTGPSIHHKIGSTTVTDFANVTAGTTIGTSGTAAASATFTIDPTLASSVSFKCTVGAPQTSAPANTLTQSAALGPYVTAPGAASKFSVITSFDSAGVSTTTKTVSGQTDYVNVVLVDYWGNTVTNTAGQIQLTLAFSPSSAGTLSATNVYIKNSASDTKGSFGTITFVINSGVTGSIALTATGSLYSGSATLTIISANPTVTVATPPNSASLNVVGHTIYSGLAGVGYSGTAAVSAGVFPAPTIASVHYTIDGGAAIAASGMSPWSFVATLSNGLHTVGVYSTDSNGLNSATNTTSILVDTSAPTITAPTTLTYGAGTPVVFTVVDTEGDLNAASVKATTNSTATLTTTVTGTNNPGSSVTYTVSVAGLPATSGHWSLTLKASDLAGNAATASSIVVRVTVSLATSVTVTGGPTSGVVGNYQGVSVTYANGWYSSQSVIVFAVWKNSLGQTVYISAASATLASGASQAFFLPEVGLASGTYTVNLSVWTTANNPVSSQTTISVTF